MLKMSARGGRVDRQWKKEMNGEQERMKRKEEVGERKGKGERRCDAAMHFYRLLNGAGVE
jgi:hypothetical protein